MKQEKSVNTQGKAQGHKTGMHVENYNAKQHGGNYWRIEENGVYTRRSGCNKRDGRLDRERVPNWRPIDLNETLGRVKHIVEI